MRRIGRENVISPLASRPILIGMVVMTIGAVMAFLADRKA